MFARAGGRLSAVASHVFSDVLVGLPLVVLIDANARAGSNLSFAIGGVHADIEDEAGSHFHSFCLRLISVSNHVYWDWAERNLAWPRGATSSFGFCLHSEAMDGLHFIRNGFY